LQCSNDVNKRLYIDIYDKPDYKLPKFVIGVIGLLVKAAARNNVQGAMTSVHVAISDEAAKSSGKYWDSCKIVAYPNKAITNNSIVDELWNRSEQYLQEKGFEV
jgi:hypothetical protein